MSPKGPNNEAKSRRLRERINLGLPVRVVCRESLDEQWYEVSRLIDVTQFGARLRLKRPVDTGRLLFLTMAMPRQLRCFDHVEDQYRVWALVRNLKLLDPAKDKGAIVEIGVAFVGKRPPQSYQEDPSKRYDAADSVSTSGLWEIAEDTDDFAEPNERRRHSRHHIPLEVVIEPFGENGELLAPESTVTENISKHGSVVFTTLALRRGQFVRVSNAQHGVRILAVVRGRRVGDDRIPRLHLEFVGAQWPLEVDQDD